MVQGLRQGGLQLRLMGLWAWWTLSYDSLAPSVSSCPVVWLEWEDEIQVQTGSPLLFSRPRKCEAGGKM